MLRGMGSKYLLSCCDKYKTTAADAVSDILLTCSSKMTGKSNFGKSMLRSILSDCARSFYRKINLALVRQVRIRVGTFLVVSAYLLRMRLTL